MRLSFWSRLQAMLRLGDATTRVADHVSRRRIASEDIARNYRLGDLEGQTSRAVAFAEKLEDAVLVDVVDPTTVVPAGWPAR